MKLYITIVLVAILAAGCKKESELAKFNESIQGSWTLQSNKLEYYNSSNEKQYEEVLSGQGSFKEITFAQNLMASIKTYDDTNINSKYDIINNDGSKYIEFNDAMVFDAQYFQIVSASESAMTWKIKFNSIQYEDTQTGEAVIAPFAILTLQLIKK